VKIATFTANWLESSNMPTSTIIGFGLYGLSVAIPVPQFVENATQSPHVISGTIGQN